MHVLIYSQRWLGPGIKVLPNLAEHHYNDNNKDFNKYISESKTNKEGTHLL